MCYAIIACLGWCSKAYNPVDVLWEWYCVGLECATLVARWLIPPPNPTPHQRENTKFVYKPSHCSSVTHCNSLLPVKTSSGIIPHRRSRLPLVQVDVYHWLTLWWRTIWIRLGCVNNHKMNFSKEVFVRVCVNKQTAHWQNEEDWQERKKKLTKR